MYFHLIHTTTTNELKIGIGFSLFLIVKPVDVLDYTNDTQVPGERPNISAPDRLSEQLLLSLVSSFLPCIYLYIPTLWSSYIVMNTICAYLKFFVVIISSVKYDY